MKRRQLIQDQGWNRDTIAHLMEHFIESNDLGERFDEFLLNTAEEENGQVIDTNKCDHTLRLLKIDKLAREEVEQSLFEAGIIEDPDVDGGLMG